ncbi:Polynucleotide 5'-hydroxyl-kinase grc3 [Coemansia sp. RSA 552]|nr:Polynucleotide 5'-hydroxyl-kinase grc3 [Coemansia sp. RSA 552]
METLASRRSTRVHTPRTSRSQTPRSATRSPLPTLPVPTNGPRKFPVATTWAVDDAPVVPVKAKLMGGGDRDGVVFGMRSGEQLAFQGIVDVCVLAGAVSVYEYTLRPGDPWTRVFSPASHPLVTIHATAVGSVSLDGGEGTEELRRLWAERGTDSDYAVVALRPVVCGLDEIGAVAPLFQSAFTTRPFTERKGVAPASVNSKRKIVLERIASPKAIRVEGQSQPMRQDSIEMEDMDEESVEIDEYVEQAQLEVALTDSIGLPGFLPLKHVTQDLQLLQVPDDWCAALDQASTGALRWNEDLEPASPVYVVAGAQGLGKSTFSRLLVNRLLNRFGRVFYMETDLGQTELAPPGALTLSVLTDPLLGPPFTHMGQVEPLHAVYMGVTTPKNDPDRYANAVQRLATVYREYTVSEKLARKAAGEETDDDRHIFPLVVNTQGWVKGLGLDLHYSLCQEVLPTHYVQIYNPAAQPAQTEGEPEYWDDGRTPIIDFGSIDNCDPQMTWISAMSVDLAAQMLVDAQSSGPNWTGRGPTMEQGLGDLSLASPVPADLPGNRKGPKLSSHEMRTLSLISHLYSSASTAEAQQWNPSLRQIPHMLWNMRMPPTAQSPLVVPWADLVIWLGEEDIPPSQALRALNGTIVGVICVAAVPSPDAHVWTDAEVRRLYSEDGKGISEQAALELSEPDARALLRSCVGENQIEAYTELGVPHLVYGNPDINSTTFLTHALVRSVDPRSGHIHLVLPPLVTSRAASKLPSLLHRVVGIAKGPGAFGIELPVNAMTDGGYAERAIGLSSGQRRFARPRARGRQQPEDTDGPGDITNVGIQEAPYLTVEIDEGIGASSNRTRGGQQRRSQQ